ncbi:MAG: type III-B CRISPR module-associated Cmr3 family protein [Chitinophagales bacterium]
MNKQSYFIRLTPLDKYFFGGEVTFGADGAGSNYLVHSNRYPQQTSILGVLRKELLIQNGLLEDRFKSQLLEDQFKDQLLTDKPTKADITALIGEKGFRLESKSRANFGVIEAISPVFLHSKEGIYLQIPADQGWHFSLLKGHSLMKESKGQIPCLKQKEGDKWLNFSEKKGLKDFLQCVDKEIQQEPNKKMFVEKSQIGIKKNLSGNTEKNAFYKQTFYTLKDSFAFGCYVTLSDGEKLKDGLDTIVEMGAERSGFRMEVKKVTDTTLAFDPKVLTGELSNSSAPTTQRIVLLSDAYIGEKDIFKHCHFALTDTTPFRYIQTSVDKTSKYYNLRDWDIDEEEIPQLSEKYNLLKRGSVLYVDKSELHEVEKVLKGFEQFRQIGYNQYQVLDA